MKVIYYSKPFFTDCDFPLVKALQDSGVDVHYYMSLPINFSHSSILEFCNPFKKFKLTRAADLPEMQKYAGCLDLNRLYFIPTSPIRILRPLIKLIWLYSMWHMKNLDADVFHFTWPFFDEEEMMIYKYYHGPHKIMTVHDPVAHSGRDSDFEEILRRKAFTWADDFLLLNKHQAVAFSEKYKINPHNIHYSHLGPYNIISKLNFEKHCIGRPYILFFGHIVRYKGLDYLLHAMKIVHEKYPLIKLVIAGGGELYFDASEFINSDYIEWRNYYIRIGELAGLLNDALFSVCPYTDATQSGVINTSLAMNCPLIVTNVGDFSRVVEEGRNAIVVPPRDINSLASAMIYLLENNNVLSEMRAYIQKQNIENDEWKNIAGTYANIYKNISV